MEQMTDQLRKLAKAYTAAWCSHNASTVAAFYSQDGWLTINDGLPAIGRAAITEAAQEFLRQFLPELHKVLGEQIAVSQG